MLDWVLHNTAFAALLATGLAVACRFGKIRPALQHALWLVVFARLLLPPVLSWPWRAPELSDVLASLSSRPSEPAPRLSGLHREEGTNDRGGEAERDPPGSFVITELTEEVPFGSTALRLRPLGDLRVRPDAPRVVDGIERDPVVDEDDIGSDDDLGETRATKADETPRWTAIAIDAPSPPPSLPHGFAGALVVSIWFVGALSLIAVEFRRIARFRRSIRSATTAPAWLREATEEISRQLGLRAPVTALVPGLASPCVWSLGRPRLFVPTYFATRLKQDAWRDVLVHELAHLRRRDHHVGWLLLLAAPLLWWNPVYWIVRGRIRFTAELACDAWVVARRPDSRRSYAESLIEISRLASREKTLLPALGASSGVRNLFKRRLLMILQTRHSRPWSAQSTITLIVFALLALPSWTGAQVDSTPGREPAFDVETGDRSNASRGGDRYRVRKGDTLREIARRELGDEDRYREIDQPNPAVQKGLRPGMKLVLPRYTEEGDTAPTGLPAETAAEPARQQENTPSIRGEGYSDSEEPIGPIGASGESRQRWVEQQLRRRDLSQKQRFSELENRIEKLSRMIEKLTTQLGSGKTRYSSGSSSSRANIAPDPPPLPPAPTAGDSSFYDPLTNRTTARAPARGNRVMSIYRLSPRKAVAIADFFKTHCESSIEIFANEATGELVFVGSRDTQRTLEGLIRMMATSGSPRSSRPGNPVAPEPQTSLDPFGNGYQYRGGRRGAGPGPVIIPAPPRPPTPAVDPPAAEAPSR